MLCIGSTITMQRVTHRRSMDGPPDQVGPTGIPRRKEPPKHPSAGRGAVGSAGGYASWTRSDARGEGMVPWHTTSHPRANWKPTGSNWLLERATGHCAGMGTDVEAQHRHGQLGLEVPSCNSWEGGAHHRWRSRMPRPLTPGNSRVEDDSQSQCEKEGSSKLRLGGGQPFSGGVRGSEERSVNSVVVRPRMARS